MRQNQLHALSIHSSHFSKTMIMQCLYSYFNNLWLLTSLCCKCLRKYCLEPILNAVHNFVLFCFCLRAYVKGVSIYRYIAYSGTQLVFVSKALRLTQRIYNTIHIFTIQYNIFSLSKHGTHSL